MIYDYIIIGGGAAGIFSAICAKEAFSNPRILILEKSSQVLSKVKISGGGRCNVTHHCYDPKELIKNYPRGHLELLSPFMRFSCKDTVRWFENKGVELKVEDDGRMFPVSNNSQTIIDVLLKQISNLDIELKFKQNIDSIEKEGNIFKIQLDSGFCYYAHNVLLSTGSHPKGYELAAKLGHIIHKPIPSLFTFNIPNFEFASLSGIATQSAKFSIKGTKLSQKGPLLITHFGFSGPSVIKLSAWAAKELHEKNYNFSILVNWLGEFDNIDVKQIILDRKKTQSIKQISSDPLFDLPKNLWKAIIAKTISSPEKKWADLSSLELEKLSLNLVASEFNVSGKTTNKEEFVTCGGVNLKEVNFKKMESKICKGLFFAGELLDIDGVTGGFNFQNAWTTGYISGLSIETHFLSNKAKI